MPRYGGIIVLVFVLVPSILQAEPIVLEQADSMDWDREQGILEAVGNVEVRMNDRRLRASRVRYNQSEDVVEAFGDVTMTGPEIDRVTGEYLRYNRETGAVQADRTRGEMAPWLFEARELERSSPDRWSARHVGLTTCTLEGNDFDIEASEIVVYPGDRIVARHAVVWIGPIPVFYSPWLRVDLRDGLSRWQFRPGYSSRDGATMEINYHYLMERDEQPVTGAIYTDFRQKVLPGIGADVEYDEPGQHAYLYYFLTRRKPLVLDEDGDEERGEDRIRMSRLRSDVDYRFDDTNWLVQGSADWVNFSRFDQQFTRNLDDRFQTDRRFRGSLLHRGVNTIFRTDFRRTDRVPGAGDADGFVQQDGVLPRVSLDEFSRPFLGFVLQTSLSGERRFIRGEDEHRNAGELRHTWNRTLYSSGILGSSITLGYRQQFEEQPGDDRTSIGSGIAEVRGQFRLTDGLHWSLSHRLEERFNRRDEQPLILFDDDPFADTGPERIESGGRLTNRLTTSLDWIGRYGWFRLAHTRDFRRAEQVDLDWEQRSFTRASFGGIRWGPVTLFGETLWNWEEEEPGQVSSGLHWSPRTGFDFELGYAWNRREDGSAAEQGTTDLRWEITEDLSLTQRNRYDFDRSLLEETRVGIRREFSCWTVEAQYRHREDRDREIWVGLSLTDLPSAQLGVETHMASRQTNTTDPGRLAAGSSPGCFSG